jgi:hypothetical protein
MAGKVTDLSGQRFGMWKVMKFHEIRDGQAYWLCKCNCGKESIVRGSSLLQGSSKGCGCTREANRVKGLIKHGGYGTRLYTIWEDMKARCSNPKAISYPNYGGKGITVCDEWQKFIPFREWALSHGYSDSLTIDRIDGSKGYSPSNCRWATYTEQANNRCSSRFITHNGETLTVVQWVRKLGISYNLLYSRIRRGWDFEKAISTPSQVRRKRKVG